MTRAPRIPPAQPTDPATLSLLAKSYHHRGEALNAARTLAHHPRLLKRFTVYAGLFLTHSLLPARDRELVTLRCTYRLRSDYYFGHHRVLASAVLSAEEIERTTRGPADWTDFDALLIEAVDELLDTDDLDELSWSRLAERYGEAQLLDFVMLVGFYRMTCLYVNTIGVEREPGIPGWPREEGEP